MLFKRIGTELLYNVTNSELLPLYEGNEAYEKVDIKEAEEKAEQPKKSTKKK